jgi:hypothetical protein
VGVQAGDFHKDIPTDNNYSPPPVDKPVVVDDYKNCTFFDKIHFTYPVKSHDKGRFKKDFDVIVASEYNDLTDLTGAVVDKLKGMCDDSDPHCPFNYVDESKIEIQGVDLAVSCKEPVK